ncbi:MAG TPA: glycosyltransferase [Steroidobacteraceae bacterium]|nr:glycosyltransferase [Steroidobacteraceae bacterium]
MPPSVAHVQPIRRPLSDARDRRTSPSVCFVGLRNLPVLAQEYAEHGAGGAEVQQTLLARALAQRGVRVSMIVGDYGQSDGASWDGIKTYKASAPEEGIPLLRFIHPRWTKLWSALRRADADIYYASCAGATLGQVALFTRLQRRKLVFRVASDTDCDPDALLVRYWRDKMLYRYGLQRADIVLAQTPHQQQCLARNFGRASRVVASLTETTRTAKGFAERDIGALWVGNIRALKRPQLLLQLARSLPEISFHMVGGPMKSHEALFTAVRTEAQSVPNVSFHGAVPYHAVGELFGRARVLVGTSEIEGFPNTYLQAWARGTPVVAFLDPQQLLSRNALGHAVTSSRDMQAAVQTLCTNAHAWEPVSRRCRQYMEEQPAAAQMLEPYLQALLSLQPPPPTTTAPLQR